MPKVSNNRMKQKELPNTHTHSNASTYDAALISQSNLFRSTVSQSHFNHIDRSLRTPNGKLEAWQRKISSLSSKITVVAKNIHIFWSF